MKYLHVVLCQYNLSFQTTYFQFVTKEYLLYKKDANQKPSFGSRTFESLLDALLNADDIDVDVLLMIREEVSTVVITRVVL